MESDKITAILVDDEDDGRDVLRNLLQSFYSGIELLGEASNVDEAYSLINEKKPQLVFLDIQMPQQSGFNLLQKFKEVPFEVIFVTSYDKYAINAIKFSALDYLLKPVELKDLGDAIAKAKKLIDLKTKRNEQILNLLRTVNSDINERRIAVHVGDNVKLLTENNILYIEADQRYCHITTTSNERYTTAKYMKEIEEYLGDESILTRIHKSCMVNVNYIKEYSKNEPYFIIMNDGKSFEIARRKKGEILEKIKK